MGFQPSKTCPIKVCSTFMSIASAKTHVAEVRAAIAEAELEEQKEYLSYRIRQYEEQLLKLQQQLAKENNPKTRIRRSR